MFRFSILAVLSIAMSPALAVQPWQPAQDCRANIRAVTCRVAGGDDARQRDPRIARPCLGGEEIYVLELTKVYDELPPKLRKAFCSLRKIYIEEEFSATGYSAIFPEVIRNPEGKDMVQFFGNVLGLSKHKIFTSKYSLSEWTNRKEQTIFGRKMEDPLLPAIPQFDISYVGVKANPLLIEVVVHEFGHMLEAAQNFITFEPSLEEKCEDPANDARPECLPKIGGLWSSISWLPDGNIRPEDRYFGTTAPCFYDCEEKHKLKPEMAVAFYRALIAANSFVSAYASSDPFEDFAESFSRYIAETYFFPENDGEKYFFTSVKFPDDQDPINLNSMKNRGRIHAKMNFMTMFDAMPWKYLKDRFTINLEQYMNPPTAVRPRNCL